MALVVETGTIVANANTYVAVADVDAFAADRNMTAWAAAVTATKEAAILAAANLLNNAARFPYRGARISYDQRMEWPREGASEYRGPTIPSNVIPWRLKDAQSLLALVALSKSLQPALDRGGKITSETVDVISTDYADDAPAETLYPEAEGLLAPLLRDVRAPDTNPGVYSPTDETPYVPGEYNFDSSVSTDSTS